MNKHSSRQQSMNALRRNAQSNRKGQSSLIIDKSTQKVEKALTIPSLEEVLVAVIKTKEKYRYYLSISGVHGSEREVTRGEFIDAERRAGFYPKRSYGKDTSDTLATAGFGNGSISGRLELIPTTDITSSDDEWEPNPHSFPGRTGT